MEIPYQEKFLLLDPSPSPDPPHGYRPFLEFCSHESFYRKGSREGFTNVKCNWLVGCRQAVKIHPCAFFGRSQQFCSNRATSLTYVGETKTYLILRRRFGRARRRYGSFLSPVKEPDLSSSLLQTHR
ncbi:uncharacterized protein LOC135631504 [Musa acuminata AAA Group]|uniref:uncharacterized protein LOC135631504 n=1 Tax=Musa acuminata AAA Group TaxID=214697 RepID=UPI0031DB2C6E